MSIQTKEPSDRTVQKDRDDSTHTVRTDNVDAGNFSIPEDQPFFRNRKLWIVIGLTTLAVAIMVILLASRPSTNQESAATPTIANTTGVVKFLMEQQWLVRMKLAQVEEQSLARQVTSIGRVVQAAHNRAIVAPPIGGLIAASQLPRIGQRVSQGQTLALLHQKPTAAEAAQIAAGNAQLRIENARMDAERRRFNEAVNEAQARLNLAKVEYERAQRLYERKAYSQRQLQMAETDYKTAQSAYTAAIEQRDALGAASKAKLGEIGVQTSYAVQAPISGTVVKVNKAVGEQVAAGEAILEIINLDTVWVEAPIFERDLYRLSQQKRAVFTTTANPNVEYSGTIIDIGAVINEQSRAATVIFEVPNPGHTLRIGMQANIRLDAGETVQAMIIPKEAVLDHEGKKIVYVLLSGEEFQRREVTLGDEYGDKVAVLSGLKATERVVTQGAYQLKLQELRPADAGAHTHET
ncbi:MAG: efflux RND transporter periplasmic adaptor subunit [Acidobacteriota bacterium]